MSDNFQDNYENGSTGVIGGTTVIPFSGPSYESGTTVEDPFSGTPYVESGREIHALSGPSFESGTTVEDPFSGTPYVESGREIHAFGGPSYETPKQPNNRISASPVTGSSDGSTTSLAPAPGIGGNTQKIEQLPAPAPGIGDNTQKIEQLIDNPKVSVTKVPTDNFTDKATIIKNEDGSIEVQIPEFRAKPDRVDLNKQPLEIKGRPNIIEPTYKPIDSAEARLDDKAVGEGDNAESTLYRPGIDDNSKIAMPAHPWDKNEKITLPAHPWDKNEKITLPYNPLDKNKKETLPYHSGDNNEGEAKPQPVTPTDTPTDPDNKKPTVPTEPGEKNPKATPTEPGEKNPKATPVYPHSADGAAQATQDYANSQSAIKNNLENSPFKKGITPADALKILKENWTTDSGIEKVKVMTDLCASMSSSITNMENAAQQISDIKVELTTETNDEGCAH